MMEPQSPEVNVVDAKHVAYADEETLADSWLNDAAPRRPRTWPAALTLYLFAAVIPEVMSGSTPPLRAIQPFNLVFLPLLYGSSALLIREAVIRLRLGWINVLLLGAAFGIFEEGLIIQTWFTSMAPTSASYTATHFSVAHGVDWSAAIAFTIFHAVFSIAIPILLVSGLFPRAAAQPWLGPRWALIIGIWLLLPSATMAWNVGHRIFATAGYHGPPEPQYAYTALAMLVAIGLGLVVRLPQWLEARLARPSTKPAPRVLVVFLTAAGLTLAYFLTVFSLATIPHMPAVIPLTLTVAVAMFSFGLVWVWSLRAGWSAAHQYALGLGVAAYFAFIMAPLQEFVAHIYLGHGLTAVSWLIFAALMLVHLRVLHMSRQQRAGNSTITS